MFLSFNFFLLSNLSLFAGLDAYLPITLEKSLCFGYTFFKTAKLPLVYGRHIVVIRSAPPIFRVHGAGLFYIIPFRLLSMFLGRAFVSLCRRQHRTLAMPPICLDEKKNRPSCDSL